MSEHVCPGGPGHERKDTSFRGVDWCDGCCRFLPVAPDTLSASQQAQDRSVTVTEQPTTPDGPETVLTAAAQRAELVQAAAALTRATLRVRTLLVQYQFQHAAALTRALAALDSQRQTIADLLKVTVAE